MSSDLAHNNVTVSDANLTKLVAYLREIGRDEGPAPGSNGLVGIYFNSVDLSGAVALTRVEGVDFSWGSGSPGAGVNADNFSVRWTGTVAATTTGNYRFQTRSDDGVRLWINGTQVVDNWTDHAPTNNNSGNVSLVAGERYTVKIEYYERGGGAVMSLRWRLPGTNIYVVIPRASLFPN